MKAVAALCTIAIATALAAQTTQADARMPGMGGGGRMMGGFQRPMMQPVGPMRSGFAAAPQSRVYPTGSFQARAAPRPTSKFEMYDYTGRYPQRFDGVNKGGSARGVGTNETITIHGNRTETTGSGFLLDGGGFRGGVASSGKSSTWIRIGQPHAGAASSRHIRHRGFSIVDRTNME